MTDHPEGGMQAALAKIQGVCDLIAERLLHANQINDERHNAVREDIKDIRETQHRHSNRIGVLEAHKTLGEGQKQGFSLAVKIGYALGGSGVMGMIALIARHFAL